jgi:peptide/nickel transport system substrate-binding protein
MPTPADGGKTFTFKILDGVKFTDGAPLTSAARSRRFAA